MQGFASLAMLLAPRAVELPRLIAKLVEKLSISMTTIKLAYPHVIPDSTRMMPLASVFPAAIHVQHVWVLR